MIKCWNTSFGEEEAAAAASVIRDGYLNEGPVTRLFENSLADFFQVPYVSAVPSGTTAVAIALMAAGVRAGDEVLVPNITFIATANAVQMIGARPILVEVQEHDMTISLKDLKQKFSRKTKAVVVVHTNGRACDIEGLREFKKNHPVPLIEDTAQGFGSKYRDRFLGTLFDLGTFSLAQSKVVSTGQGGLVMTSYPEYHEAVVRLKDHGRLSRASLEHPQPGYNFKFTDLQAAVGLEQLKKLNERLRKAKQDHNYYQQRLADLKDFKLLAFEEARGEVPLWIDARSSRRDELLEFLNTRGIEARPMWRPLHAGWLGGSDQDFATSLRLCNETFWLPSGPTIDESSLQTVVEAVREFFISRV